MTDSTSLANLSAEIAPHVAGPDDIRLRVRELGELLTGTEGRLQEIAGRGFWARTFANNSRDIALAVNDVVKMQQYTVALVLASLNIHANNLGTLEVMREELAALHGGLGHTAKTAHAQAENIVMVRSTIGQMVAVVDRQMTTARQAREQQERIADETREITAGVQRTANIALVVAVIAVLVALLVAIRVVGGAG